MTTFFAQFILIRKVSRIVIIFTGHLYPLSHTLHAHILFVIPKGITSSIAVQHHTSLFIQVTSRFLHTFFRRRHL